MQILTTGETGGASYGYTEKGLKSLSE